ncbi:DUF2256 domain-containing protein [Myxococcota bacterium]|nr:DUF2256 domain-containing protein [Myxococcota bacterium]
MSGGHQKPSERPTKVCAVCGRPFAWRRRWAKVWDEVRYCSEACRRARGGRGGGQGDSGGGASRGQ